MYITERGSWAASGRDDVDGWRVDVMSVGFDAMLVWVWPQRL